MSKGQSLQDPYLNALRKERVPVSIYLVNGIKLQGQIESFDQFVVLLKNSVSQMVYKHAISTVVPARNVKIPTDTEDEDLDLSDKGESLEWSHCDPKIMLFERPEAGQRAIILHVELNQTPNPDLDEFIELARSAEIEVVEVVKATPQVPHPRTFVGSGKVDEVAQMLRSCGADLLLINHEISPGQQRNLELGVDCHVISRTELILTIFAARARSHEGQLQVELAQLKHATDSFGSWFGLTWTDRKVG